MNQKVRCCTVAKTIRISETLLSFTRDVYKCITLPLYKYQQCWAIPTETFKKICLHNQLYTIADVKMFITLELMSFTKENEQISLNEIQIKNMSQNCHDEKEISKLIPSGQTLIFANNISFPQWYTHVFDDFATQVVLPLSEQLMTLILVIFINSIQDKKLLHNINVANDIFSLVPNNKNMILHDHCKFLVKRLVKKYNCLLCGIKLNVSDSETNTVDNWRSEDAQETFMYIFQSLQDLETDFKLQIKNHLTTLQINIPGACYILNTLSIENKLKDAAKIMTKQIVSRYHTLLDLTNIKHITSILKHIRSVQDPFNLHVKNNIPCQKLSMETNLSTKKKKTNQKRNLKKTIWNELRIQQRNQFVKERNLRKLTYGDYLQQFPDRMQKIDESLYTVKAILQAQKCNNYILEHQCRFIPNEHASFQPELYEKMIKNDPDFLACLVYGIENDLVYIYSTDFIKIKSLLRELTKHNQYMYNYIMYKFCEPAKRIVKKTLVSNEFDIISNVIKWYTNQNLQYPFQLNSEIARLATRMLMEHTTRD